MIKRVVLSIVAMAAFVNSYNVATARNIIPLCAQDSVAQASSASIDSTAVAQAEAVADSAAVAQSVAVTDSAAVAQSMAVADSAAVAQAVAVADSVNTVQPMVADSTAIVQAVDSTNLAGNVEEVAVMDTLEILNPYISQTRGKRQHFITEPLSTDEYSACYKFYKEHLAKGELFLAYDSWKKVFKSSEDRNITLFNDGVPIIMGKLANDTARQVYGNIGKYREEIEELYEIAIENVANLNEQIDYSRGGTPITAAELRSQQLFHYDNILVMDSIFNRSHHNNYDSNDDRKFWTEAIFKDSTEVYKHYAWLKEMIFSDEKMKINQLVDFSVILNTKMNNDVKRLNLKENIELARFLADQMQPEKERCIEKMNELYDDVNYGPFSAIMHTNFAAAEEFVVDDPAKLEAMYRQTIAEGGYTQEIITKILSSGPLKNAGSPLYLEALEQKYQKEPSYASALSLSDSYLKAANNTNSNLDYSKALTYYQKIFDYPEFTSKSNYEKARNYVQLATLYLKLNKRKEAYDNCEEAMTLSPEYPKSYAIIAQMVAGYPLTNREQVAFYARFIVAYEYTQKALTKITELKNSGSDAKTDLDENILKQLAASYKANFLPIEFAFNRGINDGDDYSLPLPFHKFPIKLRIAK